MTSRRLSCELEYYRKIINISDIARRRLHVLQSADLSNMLTHTFSLHDICSLFLSDISDCDSWVRWLIPSMIIWHSIIHPLPHPTLPTHLLFTMDNTPGVGGLPVMCPTARRRLGGPGHKRRYTYRDGIHQIVFRILSGFFYLCQQLAF
jgi:hypothetical protein